MKASELIEKLQESIDEHGDLEVCVQDALDPSDPIIVTEVCVEFYNECIPLDDKFSYPVFEIT